MSWSKVRPQTSSENLSVLLWNCEGLSTHLSDFHFLLTSYCPLIFILTGVGKQIRALQPVPNYKWFSQEGGNSFGGVAIVYHLPLAVDVVLVLVVDVVDDVVVVDVVVDVFVVVDVDVVLKQLCSIEYLYIL
jgi:hypothetical protein